VVRGVIVSGATDWRYTRQIANVSTEE